MILTEGLRKEIEDKEILPESQAGFRIGIGVLWITYTHIIHTTARRSKRGKTKKRKGMCVLHIFKSSVSVSKQGKIMGSYDRKENKEELNRKGKRNIQGNEG